ncbi:MAG: 50S ribosomal protein L21 [Candidatus Kerfeldbacteria bacterium]|nr:50S ribosomal protein L21 [Candidatus Kerfeldbacteria bacterium]
MFAVIQHAGKQYFVAAGQKLSVEKLAGDPGHSISIDNVLLIVDGQKIQLGQPFLEKASVKATILRQYRGPKVTVLKYKPKVRYRRKFGHRQGLTEVEITSIAV